VHTLRETLIDPPDLNQEGIRAEIVGNGDKNYLDCLFEAALPTVITHSIYAFFFSSPTRSAVAKVPPFKEKAGTLRRDD
jgi:hypothetical protein